MRCNTNGSRHHQFISITGNRRRRRSARITAVALPWQQIQARPVLVTKRPGTDQIRLYCFTKEAQGHGFTAGRTRTHQSAPVHVASIVPGEIGDFANSLGAAPGSLATAERRGEPNPRAALEQRRPAAPERGQLYPPSPHIASALGSGSSETPRSQSGVCGAGSQRQSPARPIACPPPTAHVLGTSHTGCRRTEEETEARRCTGLT